jgi:hypothetical protein
MADLGSRLPELPLEDWRETKLTLNLYAQIVGKLRLALNHKSNHWWHVPLYVSARGLTTRSMPTNNGLLEMEFDFIDHNLFLRSSRGLTKAISLYDGLTVAQFYQATVASLGQMGVQAPILPRPYDAERVGSDIPFADDELHGRYQARYVHRFWQILTWADSVFAQFSGRFGGKHSPVHLFWHSFDLAYTRFSGREAPLEGGTVVDREAYSHEVVSFGFWAGDDNVPAPSFYSYAYPEPEGLANEPLAPDEAFWADAGGSHMALLDYDHVRQASDPRLTLLSFLESAYQAGASRANWDIDPLEHKPGRNEP